MLKKSLCLGLLIALSVAALAQQSSQQASQQARPPAGPKTHLKVGDAAPDFTLPGTDGKTYTLSRFKGQKTVVLAFYVLAFTGG
jgi:cytochrome oxidase Cu insertion factor (SCO1/SenC/PrrC family)